MTSPSVLRQADPRRVNDLIQAFYRSAVVFAAWELGIFKELADFRKRDAAAIAHGLNLNPRSATLLLDACAALGLLEKEGHLYSNSADAEACLVPGRSHNLSSLLMESRELYPVWERLAAFVRGGAPVEWVIGEEGEDPEQLTAYVLSQHAQRVATGRTIIRRLDLQGRRTLLEVKGGPGTYSMLISLEFPQLQCTVLDQPAIAKMAAALIAQEGAAARVTTLPGDFHTTPFPPGNDVILLFNLLHREPKDEIPMLLQRAADALNPGGIAYVMDIMTDETHTRPAYSALSALNLALTSREGYIFSHVELQDWIERAGLKDFAVEMLPAPALQWLARAHKPE